MPSIWLSIVHTSEGVEDAMSTMPVSHTHNSMPGAPSIWYPIFLTDRARERVLNRIGQQVHCQFREFIDQ